jgi:aspartate racemase
MQTEMAEVGMNGVRTLGVIGGMGPLATADFLSKIAFASAAKSDQDHIPLVVWSSPQIPDRVTAILRAGPTPLPVMLEGIRALKSIGAQAIAFADSAAHYWHDELEAEGGVPVLSMLDAVAGVVRQRAAPSSVVALLADEDMVSTGIYQRRIDTGDYGLALPPAREQAMLHKAVELVKAGDVVGAHAIVDPVARNLMISGAGLIIVGNCELQIALARSQANLRSRVIDATAALATACVAWARGGAKS